MELKDLAKPKYIMLTVESNNLLISLLRNTGGADMPDSFRKLVNRLEEENRRLLEEAEAIQMAIDSIADKQIVDMIRMHQKGKTWGQICMRIYGYSDYGYCRKLVLREISHL